MDSFEISPTPDDNRTLQIITDDEGILVLGDDETVESWIQCQGLGQQSRKLKNTALQLGSKGFDTVGKLASQHGRWVKLTEESANKVAQYGSTGTGVLRNGGKIKHILTFENISDVSSLANPQMLTGVAGIMTQMALEQAITEITDYLEVIDGKIDDLLQDQKDQSVANLVGVAHMIDETMRIRDKVGMITDTTWSKVAGCPQDLARAQSYALLKIENLTKKLSEAHNAVNAEAVATQLHEDLHEWTSILANAIQLQDKLYVVELDRVMIERPDTMEQHRQGINEARRQRLLDIEKKLSQLNTSIRQTAESVRKQKATHPFAVTHTLQLLDNANTHLVTFAISIGISAQDGAIEMAPAWKQAAAQLIMNSKSQIERGGKQLGAEISDFSKATTQRLGTGTAQLADNVGRTVSQGTRQLRDNLADGAANTSQLLNRLLSKRKDPDERPKQ